MNELDIRKGERASVCFDIIGHIMSVCETNYDRKSLENLDFLDDYILFPIFDKLAENVYFEGVEWSGNEIKSKSLKMLKSYKSYIEDILDSEEVEE